MEEGEVGAGCCWRWSSGKPEHQQSTTTDNHPRKCQASDQAGDVDRHNYYLVHFYQHLIHLWMEIYLLGPRCILLKTFVDIWIWYFLFCSVLGFSTCASLSLRACCTRLCRFKTSFALEVSKKSLFQFCSFSQAMQVFLAKSNCVFCRGCAAAGFVKSCNRCICLSLQSQTWGRRVSGKEIEAFKMLALPKSNWPPSWQVWH